MVNLLNTDSMKRNQFSSVGIAAVIFVLLPLSKLTAQAERVSLVPDRSNSKINVVMGKKLFTTFMESLIV